jgi:hypothetical protein
MVTVADQLQSARPGSRHAERALQRLRRLARLASANDIAAVRARVARTTRIAELVMPATDPAATGDHVPVTVPHHPGNGHASPTGSPASGKDSGVSPEQRPTSWMKQHRFTRIPRRVFQETAPLR